MATPEAGWASTEEAADHLGYRPRTLMNWRCMKIGPSYEKTLGGPVRYRYSELDAWMNDPERRAADAIKASAYRNSHRYRRTRTPAA